MRDIYHLSHPYIESTFLHHAQGSSQFVPLLRI